TWTWSGGSWKNITSSISGASPPAGFWTSMAYDPASSSAFLFGGIDQSSQYGNDTGSFRAGSWTHLTPPVLQPGRHAQQMTYDTADNEMVMFGGRGPVVDLNDTWTFAGGTWASIAPGNHPGAPVGPGLAYDSSQSAVVLHGGNPARDDYYSTWTFSHGIWTQYHLSTDPPNPSNPWSQMVYVPIDGYVLLFYEPQSLEPNVQSWALTFAPGSGSFQASLTAEPASIALGATSNLTTVATAGTGTLTYSYSTLPHGCVNEDLSALPCRPSTVGNYRVGVHVTDPASNHSAAVAVLAVTSGKTALTASLAADPSAVAVNQSTTLTVSTSEFSPASLTYFYSGLPPGCDSADQASLPCTPTSVGVYAPRVEVHDPAGQFTNASTNLTVTSAGGGTSSSGLASWEWILIVVIVFLLVLVVVAAVRRPRKWRPPPLAYSPPPPPPPAPPG
ncbi:MAG: hypothetical protein ACREDE_07450, partial [Thermoplasmata archaeon]